MLFQRRTKPQQSGQIPDQRAFQDFSFRILATKGASRENREILGRFFSYKNYRKNAEKFKFS